MESLVKQKGRYIPDKLEKEHRGKNTLKAEGDDKWVIIILFTDQTEISQKYLNELSWNFLQMSKVLRGCIVIMLVISWLFIHFLHQVDIFSSKQNVSTTVRWITVKITTNIQGPYGINSNNFDDPLIWKLQFVHYFSLRLKILKSNETLYLVTLFLIQ